MNREAEFRNVARRLYNLACDIPNISGSDMARAEYHTLISARETLLTLLKGNVMETPKERSSLMRAHIAALGPWTPQSRTIDEVLL